jgi:glycogen debranching enzyme
VRVVGRPIGRDDVLWRRYMQRHEQNYPFQYHNGGCWPFAGGFWALLLHRLGWRNQGWQALEQLAAANQVGGWGFNEWLHGESGEPLGMPGQSWNAALYILARQALGDKNNFLRFSS